MIFNINTTDGNGYRVELTNLDSAGKVANYIKTNDTICGIIPGTDKLIAIVANKIVSIIG